jgi:hypothetical protein
MDAQIDHERQCLESLETTLTGVCTVLGKTLGKG